MEAVWRHGNTITCQTNRYNGSGTRIQKSENSAVTNYYYSQGGVLYTEDGSGKGTSLNLHGTAGNIIATGRKTGSSEGYYYYHKDPAGSITNLRDASRKSVVSYQYTDFGETNIYGDTDFYNEICYNEAIYDRSTGLYYLNARYYDPEDGRFISRDSYRGNVMSPSTQHLYLYCANNPINYEDPSGHIAISRIVGGIIGGAAGAFVGSKIARKTNAKGWKKVAIIAGCAVGGALVGAVAGPRVAKVAKKAVRVVKQKLPTKKVTSAARKAASKTKTAAKKTVSKAKQVISKSKSKLADVKSKVKAKKSGVKKNYNAGKDINNSVLDNIRTGSSLKEDAHHAFNDIIDNYAGNATKFSIKGRDGVNRLLYQLEGSLNGEKGIFEWIIDPDPAKGVTHRRFIKNVGITGKPNARP